MTMTMLIRSKVYQRFKQWVKEGKMELYPAEPELKGHYNAQALHLCYLLGRKKPWDEDMTEDQIAACNTLLGPHGFTFYKMLLVRRGDE